MFTVAFMTWNRAATAVKSLKSILAESLVERIYVFDDCSNEQNWPLLKQCCLSDERIVIKRNEKNCGFNENYYNAMKQLQSVEKGYVFLCESDMLMANGWGKKVLAAFEKNPLSAALAPMLHLDQFTENRSEKFQKRCLHGTEEIQQDGTVWKKKVIGYCFDEYPDKQDPVFVDGSMIRFVSNCVCTIVFRQGFLQKIELEEMNKFPAEQDAWISWACFHNNNRNPKSIMVFDPGLALTFGEEGLHGAMYLNNLRWTGSFWWRYDFTAKLIRWFGLKRITIPMRLRRIFGYESTK